MLFAVKWGTEVKLAGPLGISGASKSSTKLNLMMLDVPRGPNGVHVPPVKQIIALIMKMCSLSVVELVSKS